MLKYFCFAILMACGGKTVDGLDGGGNDAGDASLPPDEDANPPPPVGDGGDCNTLTASGNVVSVTSFASDPPPFTGNNVAISPGLYDMVALSIYTGPNGSSGSSGTVDAVARFSSAKNGFLVDVLAIANGADAQRESINATTTSQGLSLVPFCPAAGPTMNVLTSFDGKLLTMRVLAQGDGTIDEQFELVGP